MSRNKRRFEPNPKFEKIIQLPNSKYSDSEIEKSLLAMILSQDESQLEAFQYLTSEMFFFPRYKQIFQLIQDLRQSKKNGNLFSYSFHEISSFYEANKQNYQLISQALLNEISTTFFNLNNFYNYIDTLIAKNKLRNIEAFFKDYSDKMQHGEKLEFNDVVNDFNEFLLEKAHDDMENSNFKLIEEVASDYRELIEKIWENQYFDNVLPTKFKSIDKYVQGFKPGQLIILAARPGIGKTALALNIARNIALDHINQLKNQDNLVGTIDEQIEQNPENSRPKNVAFISLEMAVNELLARTISSTVAIPLYFLQNPNQLKENPEYRERFDYFFLKYIKDMNIYFDDAATSKINDIVRKIKHLVKNLDGKLDLIVIDYLQLISTDGPAGNRQNEVSTISRALKVLALELKIPILALSQLSRSVESREDKRPHLHDLRESGAIEQDADIVIMLHRDRQTHNSSEEGYERDRFHGYKTTITIAKNRGGVSDVSSDLIYLGSNVSFIDENLDEMRNG
ncbi:DnaB-like helicase C-terminal domain-containing protein [Mycoplasmopsis gallopavonis]|uniref:DNA 5'-3' helicase n=1 Tax=Mycoplasmopsis gallopavonis TaxID=76629 RepID=A0A449AZT5_9BACT|nr:DnaB-like helicase C-terminal domain-containing protein [Mycoplasmopsis gallopavonis]RIV16897.1 DNA helicase [Mycoplasmopsis gallopavonis]VEU73023.1 Replicative DNA helicase [Mycoplasmopsis gallopavonis]